jgi:hypothetical protein
MARPTKAMVRAAYAELDCINELATDPEAFGGQNATYQYHAPAASRHLATLVAAGQPLPGFIAQRGEKYMRAMGWRW